MKLWEKKRNEEFSDDCLAEAVRMARGKNLLFVTCMNPYDFYGTVNIPKDITSTSFIGMTCSDEEILRDLSIIKKHFSNLKQKLNLSIWRIYLCRMWKLNVFPEGQRNRKDYAPKELPKVLQKH